MKGRKPGQLISQFLLEDRRRGRSSLPNDDDFKCANMGDFYVDDKCPNSAFFGGVSRSCAPGPMERNAACSKSTLSDGQDTAQESWFCCDESPSFTLRNGDH